MEHRHGWPGIWSERKCEYEAKKKEKAASNKETILVVSWRRLERDLRDTRLWNARPAATYAPL